MTAFGRLNHINLHIICHTQTSIYTIIRSIQPSIRLVHIVELSAKFALEINLEMFSCQRRICTKSHVSPDRHTRLTLQIVGFLMYFPEITDLLDAARSPINNKSIHSENIKYIV